jgi:glycosyltransferase 2 family protein
MTLLRAGIGIFVSAAFIYLFVREVDLGALGSALLRADPGWIGTAVGCILLGQIIRAARWWLMICAVASAPVRFSACLGPFFASFATNNVLPLRAGDALRIFAFTRRLNTPASRIFGTMVVERVLDLVALLLIIAAASVFVANLQVPGALLSSLQLLVLIAIAGAAFLLIAPVPALRSLDAAVSRTPGGGTRIVRAAAGTAQSVLKAIRDAGARDRLPMLVALTVIGWSAEAAVIVCVGYGFQADLGVAAACFGYAIGTLATLLPGSPGHFGTFEYFAAQGLHLSGLAPTLAAAVAILGHLVIWAPVTVIGAGYLIANPVGRLAASGKAAAYFASPRA